MSIERIINETIRIITARKNQLRTIDYYTLCQELEFIREQMLKRAYPYTYIELPVYTIIIQDEKDIPIRNAITTLNSWYKVRYCKETPLERRIKWESL